MIDHLIEFISPFDNGSQLSIIYMTLSLVVRLQEEHSKKSEDVNFGSGKLLWNFSSFSAAVMIITVVIVVFVLCKFSGATQAYCNEWC